jgi:hypothetical protein
MAQEIGESRDAWGRDVMAKAEEFANGLKNDTKPFYIVFAAKQDKAYPGLYRQAFRFYRQRPPKMLGILVWYCDHSKSEFRFVPELSMPPDVPVDPNLLSTKREDELPSVMEKGKEMNVLLS